MPSATAQIRVGGTISTIESKTCIHVIGRPKSLTNAACVGKVAIVPHKDNVMIEGTVQRAYSGKIGAVDIQYVLVAGTVQQIHSDQIRGSGTVQLLHNNNMRMDGNVILGYNSQVMNEGIVQRDSKLQVRAAGTVSGIPHLAGIMNEGEISEIAGKYQIMVYGRAIGQLFQHQIMVQSSLESEAFKTGIRATGIPWLTGNYNHRALCTGWYGERPRRPPYDMRMMLDHYIRRMRGTVKLYHYEVGTTSHRSYVKPDPVVYDLTGRVFFERSVTTNMDYNKHGVVDQYTGRLIIDSSNLPSGLTEINHKHDIIEYNDPDGESEIHHSRQYRFKTQGRAMEEWHGLVMYDLVAMLRHTTIKAIHRGQFVVGGTIAGQAHDNRVMMRGIVG